MILSAGSLVAKPATCGHFSIALDQTKFYIATLIPLAGPPNSNNSVTGDPTSYLGPYDTTGLFPAIWTIMATCWVFVRIRTVHQSIPTPVVPYNSSGSFSTLLTNAGYSQNLIGTQQTPSSYHATNTSFGPGNSHNSFMQGTNNLAYRPFNVIGNDALGLGSVSSFGTPIPPNTFYPISIESPREAWIQVIGMDPTYAATSGEFFYSLHNSTLGLDV